MTKNIKINADAKTSHLVLGLAIHEVFQFLPFLFVFSPALLLGLWMFGNLTESNEREREFGRRVEACTAAQLQECGTSDQYSCKKAVNAEFRVYENL